MTLTLQDKINLINQEILCLPSSHPLQIAEHFMAKDFVSMHGPEHHYLDGAAFLTAYRNAGGAVNLPEALGILEERAMKMPGAMCG